MEGEQASRGRRNSTLLPSSSHQEGYPLREPPSQITQWGDGSSFRCASQTTSPAYSYTTKTETSAVKAPDHNISGIKDHKYGSQGNFGLRLRLNHSRRKLNNAPLPLPLVKKNESLDTQHVDGIHPPMTRERIKNVVSRRLSHRREVHQSALRLWDTDACWFGDECKRIGGVRKCRSLPRLSAFRLQFLREGDSLSKESLKLKKPSVALLNMKNITSLIPVLSNHGTHILDVPMLLLKRDYSTKYISAFYLLESDFVLRALIEQITPSEHERYIKRSILNALTALIKMWKGDMIQVYVAGSTAYDVDCTESDLDVVLMTSETDYRLFLEELSSRIIQSQRQLPLGNQNNGFPEAYSSLDSCHSPLRFVTLQLVQNARVPILLLKCPHGVVCDISVNANNSISHTNFFKAILHGKPHLRALMRLVKYWVKVRRIPVMRDGGLPNIVWMLLCVFASRHTEICYSSLALTLAYKKESKDTSCSQEEYHQQKLLERFASRFTRWMWNLRLSSSEANVLSPNTVLLSEFFSRLGGRDALTCTVSVAAGLCIPKNPQDVAQRVLSPSWYGGVWDELISVEDPAYFNDKFFPEALLSPPASMLSRDLAGPNVSPNGIPTPMFQDLVTRISSATWLVYQYELCRADTIMGVVMCEFKAFQQEFLRQPSHRLIAFLKDRLKHLVVFFVALFAENGEERYRVPAILPEKNSVHGSPLSAKVVSPSRPMVDQSETSKSWDCSLALVLLEGRLMLLDLVNICADRKGWWSTVFLTRRDIRWSSQGGEAMYTSDELLLDVMRCVQNTDKPSVIGFQELFLTSKTASSSAERSRCLLCDYGLYRQLLEKEKQDRAGGLVSLEEPYVMEKDRDLEILFNPCNLVCFIRVVPVACNTTSSKPHRMYAVPTEEMEKIQLFVLYAKEAPYWYSNVPEVLTRWAPGKLEGGSHEAIQPALRSCKQCGKAGIADIKGNLGLPHCPLVIVHPQFFGQAPPKHSDTCSHTEDSCDAGRVSGSVCVLDEFLSHDAFLKLSDTEIKETSQQKLETKIMKLLFNVTEKFDHIFSCLFSALMLDDIKNGAAKTKLGIFSPQTPVDNSTSSGSLQTLLNGVTPRPCGFTSSPGFHKHNGESAAEQKKPAPNTSFRDPGSNTLTAQRRSSVKKSSPCNTTECNTLHENIWSRLDVSTTVRYSESAAPLPRTPSLTYSTPRAWDRMAYPVQRATLAKIPISDANVVNNSYRPSPYRLRDKVRQPTSYAGGSCVPPSGYPADAGTTRQSVAGETSWKSTCSDTPHTSTNPPLGPDHAQESLNGSLTHDYLNNTAVQKNGEQPKETYSYGNAQGEPPTNVPQTNIPKHPLPSPNVVCYAPIDRGGMVVPGVAPRSMLLPRVSCAPMCTVGRVGGTLPYHCREYPTTNPRVVPPKVIPVYLPHNARYTAHMVHPHYVPNTIYPHVGPSVALGSLPSYVSSNQLCFPLQSGRVISRLRTPQSLPSHDVGLVSSSPCVLHTTKLNVTPVNLDHVVTVVHPRFFSASSQSTKTDRSNATLVSFTCPLDNSSQPIAGSSDCYPSSSSSSLSQYSTRRLCDVVASHGRRDRVVNAPKRGGDETAASTGRMHSNSTSIRSLNSHMMFTASMDECDVITSQKSPEPTALPLSKSENPFGCPPSTVSESADNGVRSGGCSFRSSLHEKGCTPQATNSAVLHTPPTCPLSDGDQQQQQQQCISPLRHPSEWLSSQCGADAAEHHSHISQPPLKTTQEHQMPTPLHDHVRNELFHTPCDLQKVNDMVSLSFTGTLSPHSSLGTATHDNSVLLGCTNNVALSLEPPCALSGGQPTSETSDDEGDVGSMPLFLDPQRVPNKFRGDLPRYKPPTQRHSIQTDLHSRETTGSKSIHDVAPRGSPRYHQQCGPHSPLSPVNSVHSLLHQEQRSTFPTCGENRPL